MKPETLSLQGALHEIERATGFASRFCRAHGLDRADERILVLILEELITNTVKHGAAPADATIELALDMLPGGVSLTYRDHGKPFNPHVDVVEPDLSMTVTRRPVGGLGWPLIKFYCSRLDYRRDGDTNLLQMTVRPAREQTAELG